MKDIAIAKLKKCNMPYEEGNSTNNPCMAVTAGHKILYFYCCRSADLVRVIVHNQIFVE